VAEVVKEAPPPPPHILPKLVVPKHKPAPAQRPKFDVDSVLALLAKRTPPKPTATPLAKLADNTLKGIGSQTALTLDVKDALLSQMRACWNVPVGAPNPEQLIVQVRVFLAQDGKLAQAPQLEPASRAAASGNPYMRTAAEAALRAVSVCEPYKRLPVDKYDAWREIVMTFDPSKMIGR
jgi:colicin import membrane protein